MCAGSSLSGTELSPDSLVLKGSHSGPLVKFISARDDRVITADYLRSGGSTISGGGYYTSAGHEYLTVSFW